MGEKGWNWDWLCGKTKGESMQLKRYWEISGRWEKLFTKEPFQGNPFVTRLKASFFSFLWSQSHQWMYIFRYLELLTLSLHQTHSGLLVMHAAHEESKTMHGFAFPGQKKQFLQALTIHDKGLRWRSNLTNIWMKNVQQWQFRQRKYIITIYSCWFSYCICQRQLKCVKANQSQWD